MDLFILILGESSISIFIDHLYVTKWKLFFGRNEMEIVAL